MKKTLLTLFAAACALVAGAQNVATAVAGNYTGDLWVALAAPVDTTDADTKMSGQEITLTAGEAENTIDLALYNFQFAGIPVGDIELPGVPVSEADGVVTFGDIPAVTLSFLGGVIQATARINPTESSLADGVLNAKIDVVWTNSDPSDPTATVPINVFFKGKTTNTTGIASVTAAAPVATGVYTLSGVRVRTTADTQGLPAGLYIINGNKVIIK